eukprot:scaffold275883_cov35-Tisochrysis_lutea.AAC.1
MMDLDELELFGGFVSPPWSLSRPSRRHTRPPHVSLSPSSSYCISILWVARFFLSLRTPPAGTSKKKAKRQERERGETRRRGGGRGPLPPRFFSLPRPSLPFLARGDPPPSLSSSTV